MTDPNPGGWAPCPPSELEQFVARLAFLRRLRAVGAGLIVAAAVGGVGGVGGWAVYHALSSDPPATTPAAPCVDDHCPLPTGK